MKSITIHRKFDTLCSNKVICVHIASCKVSYTHKMKVELTYKHAKSLSDIENGADTYDDDTADDEMTAKIKGRIKVAMGITMVMMLIKMTTIVMILTMNNWE